MQACQLTKKRIPLLDLLKWVALITMVIDHAVYLAPGTLDVLHVPGRISFPLFALVMAMHVFRQLPGEIHRPENWTWLKKLALYGCIAQPVFMMYVGSPTADIMFTLAIGLGLALAYHHRSTFAPAMVCILLLSLFSIHWSHLISYGICGVLLPVAFVYALERRTVETWLAPACLAFAMNIPTPVLNDLIVDPVATYQDGNQLMVVWASVAALTCLVGLAVCKQTISFRVPAVTGWAYMFYPAHLVFLAMVALI